MYTWANTAFNTCRHRSRLNSNGDGVGCSAGVIRKRKCSHSTRAYIYYTCMAALRVLIATYFTCSLVPRPSQLFQHTLDIDKAEKAWVWGYSKSLNSHVHTCMHAGTILMHLQWNLPNLVTFGPKIFGFIMKVAAIAITAIERSLRKGCQTGRFMEAHHL